MALDLKIVTISPQGQLAAYTWPNPAFVEGTYALVQRIYKNLMTIPGQDAFDPSWGSDLKGPLFNTPLGGDTDDARHAIAGVIQKCEMDIQSDPTDDPRQQLLSLRLLDAGYDVSATAWNISLEATTRAGAVRFSLSA